MAANLDTLKQGYEAFSKGDIETATESWADDIVWEGPNSEDVPGGGEHAGKEAALKTLQEAVGAWDEFSLSPDEFYEGSDTVVVLGHANAKKGDQSAETPIVHIWRFGDDGKVKRFQSLTDTLQSARMLGIV
ncbi:MAG TPA: nuclear transport factor 2 family protein [Thermoleophilaceae bacterium]|nr:nuclear transport factor 2 family protein [Thermoleophilaceae bacterium]